MYNIYTTTLYYYFYQGISLFNKIIKNMICRILFKTTQFNLKLHNQ